MLKPPKTGENCKVDWRTRTIETYNQSAEALARYFEGIGPRIKYINRGIGLLDTHTTNPNIVEIGCGDGRDASDITTKTTNYIGFDISPSFIDIAKAKVPEAHFEVADAVDFDYPENTDIVFAFASMLHLDRDEFGHVLSKVHTALNPDGIFYISTKYSLNYCSGVKKDVYGERMFYYYDVDTVRELSQDKYSIDFIDIEQRGDTQWLEIALRKK